MTLYGPIKLNANIMQQILDILCTNPILYIGFNMTRTFGLKHLKLVLEMNDTREEENEMRIFNNNLYLDLTRSDQFSCDYRIVWNQTETTSRSDKARVC